MRPSLPHPRRAPDYIWVSPLGALPGPARSSRWSGVSLRKGVPVRPLSSAPSTPQGGGGRNSNSPRACSPGPGWMPPQMAPSPRSWSGPRGSTTGRHRCSTRLAVGRGGSSFGASVPRRAVLPRARRVPVRPLSPPAWGSPVAERLPLRGTLADPLASSRSGCYPAPQGPYCGSGVIFRWGRFWPGQQLATASALPAPRSIP